MFQWEGSNDGQEIVDNFFVAYRSDEHDLIFMELLHIEVSLETAELYEVNAWLDEGFEALQNDDFDKAQDRLKRLKAHLDLLNLP